MNLTELRALASRWTEAANARSQYGGEDATSGAVRTCAQELEELLGQIGVPRTNGLGLGEGYVTVADLATWIGGVSQSTVRRWLRGGRFPGAWQLDNDEWRIPRRAAVGFVENRRDAPARKRNGKRRYDRQKFVQRFKKNGGSHEAEATK